MNTPPHPSFSEADWPPLATMLLRQFAQGIAQVEPESGTLTWHLCPSEGPLARAHLSLKDQIRSLADHLIPSDQAPFAAWVDKWPGALPPPLQCRVLDPLDQTSSWVQFLVLSQPGQTLLLLHDLTEETRLITESAELRRVETVETMAAGIAHEFNNNLTPVRGYLELGLDEIGPNHPASEGLKTALSRVEHCAELIDQLQHYGRGVLLHRREANMAHLVRSLVHIGIALFDNPAAPVQLRENIDSDLPPVRIDHGRFREIIYQVLKNALAAMSEGGILQVWANSVSSQDLRPQQNRGESDFIRLRFIDNGVGIDPDHMTRVFDPFFTTSSRAEKRGLGLSVTQGIVAQHGGWVELHSIKDQGTEVRIFLPTYKPQSTVDVSDDPDEAIPVKAAARPGRMLIADDEAFIRQLVSRIFEPEGWLIDEAVTHEEVIQLASRHPNYYQLVMLDITMPGPTPEESVAELTRCSPDTRIVLMSGLQRASRIDQLIELGAKSFIPKPFSPKRMIGVVDEVMANAPAPDQ